MHSHDKTNERTLANDALTMQLNVVKAITESSAVSLSFWRIQVIRICRPRRLYQGQFRAKYWKNTYILPEVDQRPQVELAKT